MMIFWFNFFMIFTHDFEMFYFPTRAMPTKYRGFRTALFSALGLQILVFVRMAFSTQENFVREWITVISVIVYLSYCIVVLSGTLWKKIAVFMVFWAMEAGIELLVSAFVVSQFGEIDLAWTTPGMLVAQLLFGLAYTILGLLVIRLWGKEDGRIRGHDLIFFMFLLVQGILFSLRSWFSTRLYRMENYELITIFAVTAADIILVLVMEEIESRNRTKQEIKELSILQEQEAFRYQAMIQKQEDLEKLRHDYKNQLQTVAFLLEEGEKNSGKVLLRNVQKQIE